MTEEVKEQPPPKPKPKYKYKYPYKRKNKPRGRQSKMLPFEEARRIVREEQIPSVEKYKEWWDREKPKKIPKYPYRAYQKEFTTWNDFLGTDNVFSTTGRQRVFRPLEEATMWAHTLGLRTSTEWMDFIKNHRDQLPDDVPARPDLSYLRWISWNHFLGNKPKEAIEAKQICAPKTRIFYIIRRSGVPLNVFNYGIEDAGIAMIQDRQAREHFEIIRLFWFDPEQAEKVKSVVNTLSTPYYGDERQRITPNVHDVVWHLQTILETVISRR